MAHIEFVKQESRTYLRICEGRLVKETGKIKKIVIKNLGPLSRWDDGEPNFLERFREKFRTEGIEVDDILYKGTPKKEYHYALNFNEDIFTTSAQFKNFGYVFLEKIFEDLHLGETLRLAKSRQKISYDLVSIVKLLTYMRILKPDSKLGTFNEKDNFFNNPFASITNVKDVYRALDVLADKSLAIQQRINTSITNSSIGRNTDLLYYDVTNYYFETMYGDDDVLMEDENGELVLDTDGKPIILKPGIRKKGVSKENRKEPIVQMGLFIDQNGIPVSYDIFPGNMQDKTTFTHMLKTHHLPMDFKRAVVVADNGMHTQGNLYLLIKNGDGYIIAESVRRKWKSMREWVLDDTDYHELYYAKDENGNNLKGENENNLKSGNGNNICTYKYKSKIEDRILKGGDGKTITIKQKTIVFWSKAHADRDRLENQKFVEYLEACRENPDKFKDKSKVKPFFKAVQINKKTGEKVDAKDKAKIIYELDEAKLKAMQEVYGYYAIVTSEIDTPDIEIIRRYHSLSKIEDAFRITKSDLEGRPIYVRTEEHIRAHFLICFIALVIIRIIQNKYLKLYAEPLGELDSSDKYRHWQQGITAEQLRNALQFGVASDEKGVCITNIPEGYRDIIAKLFTAFNVETAIFAPTTTEFNRLHSRIRKNSKL